ncbi:MAG: hypothetical protein ACYDC1_17825, partial [Limisphaerales bacterium]
RSITAWLLAFGPERLADARRRGLLADPGGFRADSAPGGAFHHDERRRLLRKPSKWLHTLSIRPKLPDIREV